MPAFNLNKRGHYEQMITDLVEGIIGLGYSIEQIEEVECYIMYCMMKADDNDKKLQNVFLAISSLRMLLTMDKDR
ncbi:MAG: hypothetical protein AAFX87_17145 [Bacteroidota bacterium]